jgi:4-hydroxy-tetrahydrodipicolinate synthase
MNFDCSVRHLGFVSRDGGVLELSRRKGFRKKLLRGIIVPLVTPFKRTPEQELDLMALKKHVEFLIENGVDGLMPLGTTGEFALLNRDERREVVRRVVETANGKIPVIAGVSESGTDMAIALAKDAEEVGADQIIATGPYYYKTNDEGLYLHYQAILDAVELPLMIYNIPTWVGYNIPAGVVRRLVDRNPRRVVGVKYTTNDMALFLDYIRELREDLSIFIGSDDLIYAALELGAAGAVAGSANVLPNETTMVYECFDKSNLTESKKHQDNIHSFARTMNLGTYPSALKEALAMVGRDCGPVRRPLVALSNAERAQVKASLEWKPHRR